MTFDGLSSGRMIPSSGELSPGRVAQIACLLEVSACKPGNVHRLRDFPDLTFLDFALSAVAIAEPMHRAIENGVGSTVDEAIKATRRVVATNTNLGIVLLLAPLAAVPAGVGLEAGIESVLDATTVADSRTVYRAIRMAQPGGMGDVSDQDLANEPSMTLREIMRLAADRDAIARQYANGFREVFGEALPAIRGSLEEGRTLETAIVGAYLKVLARHSDSLIVRKAGIEAASRPLNAPGKSSFTVGPTARKPDRNAKPSTIGSGTRADALIRVQRPTWSRPPCTPRSGMEQYSCRSSSGLPIKIVNTKKVFGV